MPYDKSDLLVWVKEVDRGYWRIIGEAVRNADGSITVTLKSSPLLEMQIRERGGGKPK